MVRISVAHFSWCCCYMLYVAVFTAVCCIHYLQQPSYLQLSVEYTAY